MGSAELRVAVAQVEGQVDVVGDPRGQARDGRVDRFGVRERVLEPTLDRRHFGGKVELDRQFVVRDRGLDRLDALAGCRLVGAEQGEALIEDHER